MTTSTESSELLAAGFPGFRVGLCPVGDEVIGYRVAGSGPDVLLVHGFPQTGYEWRDVASALAEHFRVIVVDCRGAGGSSKPAGGYDKSTMARDVRAVLDHLGSTAAHIVGHDIGMMVAFAYARQFESDTTTLTMMDAVIPGTPLFTQLVTANPPWHFLFHRNVELATALVRDRERLYFDHFFDTFMVDRASVPDADRDFYVQCMRAPGALEAGIKGYAAFPGDGVENLAWLEGGGRLTMPVLMLGGAASLGPYMKALGEEVADDVTTVVIDDAGHFVAEEKPAEVVGALSTFLAAAAARSEAPRVS